MTGSYLAAERGVAIRAVQAACSITSNVFQHLVSSESITKQDKSPVTIGDFSAQAVVNEVLSRHFPNDGIVGEEDSADLQGEKGADLRSKVSRLVNDSLLHHGEIDSALSDQQLLQAIDLGSFPGGTSKRFWALDPIDGTKGFLRGGQYAVCLALLVEGRVELGVMGCPNLPLDSAQAKPADGEIRSKEIPGLGAMFIAVRGQGAYVVRYDPMTDNQRPIQGKDAQESRIHMRDLHADFSKAAFCESVEAGHSSLGTNARIAELLGIPKGNSVRMDSQAKYASIARGDGDIYLRLPVGDGSYEEKIWDHAAGAILVEEAGGSVSDIAGRPLDFRQGRTLRNNRGVIASESGMHSKLTQVVAQALQEEGRAKLLEPKTS
ncbi:3'(2'),5'-bisphosphate nucleotidase [Malassezia yamatoensis]|uniref:3'(2'),5'-bisphosphate nucleotidase n=1 Tax=Malassezia yamatoensis TaxID=253288 RepID=A0AAJ6CI52_9BASI|nr:3'(2'),5'-bisphosphate nucleotidase [Malassezia yamatoensis]